MSDGKKVGRRELLAAGAITGLALAGCAPAASGQAPRAHEERRAMETTGTRQPSIYLPHGGGPWPFVELGFGDPSEYARLAEYLRGLGALTRPRALLVISAHWEERVPTIMTSPQPPMLYDYYGFPPESYRITWPAPGAPELAPRVRELLRAAGIDTAEDAARGFDHGTFVPLKLAFPEASVPTLQLSLRSDLDPARHLAIGRALTPLRDEGVMIVGSGMSFHNMRAFRGGGFAAEAQAFDAWLRETVTLSAAEREARLERWAEAPSARASHPREEHLLPLMVVAGAAGGDRASVPYSDAVLGHRVSAVHFG